MSDHQTRKELIANDEVLMSKNIRSVYLPIHRAGSEMVNKDTGLCVFKSNQVTIPCKHRKVITVHRIGKNVSALREIPIYVKKPRNIHHPWLALYAVVKRVKSFSYIEMKMKFSFGRFLCIIDQSIQGMITAMESGDSSQITKCQPLEVSSQIIECHPLKTNVPSHNFWVSLHNNWFLIMHNGIDTVCTFDDIWRYMDLIWVWDLESFLVYKMDLYTDDVHWDDKYVLKVPCIVKNMWSLVDHGRKIHGTNDTCILINTFILIENKTLVLFALIGKVSRNFTHNDILFYTKHHKNSKLQSSEHPCSIY